MLRFTMHRAGFEVTTVVTGAEALQTLEQGNMDAVVLDLGLPDGLGGLALQRLQQLRQGSKNSPAWVTISALHREEATQRYGPLGEHFLAKPFDPWVLVRLLEKLLAERALTDRDGG